MTRRPALPIILSTSLRPLVSTWTRLEGIVHSAVVQTLTTAAPPPPSKTPPAQTSSFEWHAYCGLNPLGNAGDDTLLGFHGTYSSLLKIHRSTARGWSGMSSKGLMAPLQTAELHSSAIAEVLERATRFKVGRGRAGVLQSRTKT